MTVSFTSTGSRRRRHGSLGTLNDGPSSPHIPDHYSIDQPGDHTKERYDGVEGSDEHHLDARESVEIAYYSPGDEPVENDNDELHEQRLVAVEDHPDENVSGHAVTTTIEVGDLFDLDNTRGVWGFVGVSKFNPQRLMFVPVDAAAERAQYFPYATYLRSDFAQKLSGINPEHDIERLEEV